VAAGSLFDVLAAYFDEDADGRFTLEEIDDDVQESPHITIIDFNGNDTGDASFTFDRWYVRGTTAGFWPGPEGTTCPSGSRTSCCSTTT
jgi:hypothetical protein